MPNFGPLSEVSEEWLLDRFRRSGHRGTSAVRSARSFLNWRDEGERKPRANTIGYKLMADLACLHVSAISHYWSDINWDKLALETRNTLDAIARDLGVIPPVRTRIRALRLALLASLHNAPSPRFHLETICGIAQSAERLQFNVSIHDVSHEPPLGSEAMMPLVRRIVNHARPSAMAFLRATPDDNTMNFLFRRKIPTVVIHGDLRSYRSPIIGHIVPDQQHIAHQMGKWIRWLASTIKPRKVIIGAMHPETGDNRTIRSERISLIERGLRSAGLLSHRFEVADYSAANALAILTAYPDADAFACLSDELALGVAHLLIARGITDGLRRVLGFDGSSLARNYGIATIDQNLDRIGDTVAETLTAFFTRFPTPPRKWPTPREIPVH